MKLVMQKTMFLKTLKRFVKHVHEQTVWRDRSTTHAYSHGDNVLFSLNPLVHSLPHYFFFVLSCSSSLSLSLFRWLCYPSAPLPAPLTQYSTGSSCTRRDEPVGRWTLSRVGFVSYLRQSV
jgi:hypothetical protein